MTGERRLEPKPGAALRGDLFGRRLSRLLALTLPALFVITFVYILTSPVGSQSRRQGSNTYSVSAVGFKALVNFLGGLDLRVLSSRRASGQLCGPSTPLVLLEPPMDAASETTLDEMIAQAESRRARVVVVLPKWISRPQAGKSDWAGAVWPLPSQAPRAVLSDLLGRELGTSTVIRLDRPTAAGWEASFALTEPPFLPYPQLMSPRISGLEPIVWSGSGVLAARIEGRDIIVVSDPDLMNNVGLAAAGNAVLSHRLLVGGPAARAIVFDETLHGFTAAPSIWREFLRFPLNLVAIQLAMLLITAVWIGSSRFGPAEPPPPRYAAGSATLIDATGRLFSLAGRPRDALLRYWNLMLRRTSDELGQLPGSGTRRSQDEVIAHLNAIGRRRGAATNLEDLAAEIDRLTDRDADRAGVLLTAQSIFTWRRDVIHGPH
jgi:hypothetical protein